MPPHHPMAKATMAATALAMTSNILAQLLEAYRNSTQETPKSAFAAFTMKQPQHAGFKLDYVQILRYSLLVFLTTPPNYLWQAFLERSFPAYGPSGRTLSDGSAGSLLKDGKNEKKGSSGSLRKQRKDSNADLKLHNLDVEKHAGTTPLDPSSSVGSGRGGGGGGGGKRKLNWRNTLTKWFIDCITIGALLNTLAFFILMGLLKGQPAAQIVQNVKTQTFPLIVAGYKVWPFASIISFSMIPVEKRVIFLNFVGLLWGIYMSIIASRV